MSEDIEKSFMEAILKIRDEQQQAVFLLLFRLVRQVADSVEHLGEQLTVDAALHAEHHRWISAKVKEEALAEQEGRTIKTGVKVNLAQRAANGFVNGIFFAAGLAALKLAGVAL